MTVHLDTNSANFTDAPHGNADQFDDVLMGIEWIRGSYGADGLHGDGNENRFRGLAGADSLNGNGGFDTADYSGDLSITSGSSLVADSGISVNMTGSQIVGTFNGNTVNATSVLDTFGDMDTFTSIERFVGTVFSDEFYGDGSDNVFVGGDGADYFAAMAATTR